METESVLTTREVLRKYKINKYTLLNWRRGFYYGLKGKTFFFADGSLLESNWNEELRRLEYSPIKVAVWVNKLAKKHGKN